jgi:hypothetical protein
MLLKVTGKEGGQLGGTGQVRGKRELGLRRDRKHVRWEKQLEGIGNK